MRPLLGTFVEIAAAGDSEPSRAAIDEAFARIAEVQRLLSFHDRGSELSLLNASRGEWVPMSPVSLRALRLARAMGRASDGRFNCTVGGRLVADGVLPDHRTGARLAVGCANDIGLCPDAARLARPVLLTLDGIAKGFAVDRAVAALMRHRLDFGWVNAGGDLRVFGPRRLPILRRELDGTLQTLTELHEGALATSRAGAHDDPDLPGRITGGADTGTPADFTVRARRAWRADALTKVAALAPAAERTALLHSLGGNLVTRPMQCNA